MFINYSWIHNSIKLKVKEKNQKTIKKIENKQKENNNNKYYNKVSFCIYVKQNKIKTKKKTENFVEKKINVFF